MVRAVDWSGTCGWTYQWMSRSNVMLLAGDYLRNRCTQTMSQDVVSRDGKQPKLIKNKPNPNPGYSKNRTEPESYIYRTRTKHKLIFKVLRTRTEPNPYHQRTTLTQNLVSSASLVVNY